VRRVRMRASRVRGADTAPAPDLGPLLERLNPATLAAATGHRVILHRHLTAVGLAVPRLHGAVGRAGGWSAASGRPVIGAAAAGRFLAALPGDLAVRPCLASPDETTRLLGRDGEELVEDGRRRKPSEVASDLYADPACDLFVVQERVGSAGETPPVVQLITLVADDGAARVVHTRLAGAAGAGVELDPASAGDHLPRWDAACDLACRAALLLTPQRAIAWELALAPAGPVILGADSRYAHPGGARFDAALREMERVAGGAA
jgi:hypothetical protein